MSEKIVSQLDQDGYFVAAVVADESPLEPGTFLMPAGAIDEAPPTVKPGTRAKYTGKGFVFENIPVPEPEPGPKPAPAEIMRAQAYRDEADPLFFKWQRDEATKAEWLAKIAEIKARYPDAPAA
ncbi:hypothetical protein [Microvirga alba]|uniref:Phage tail protein n=1 Tax=Microvirga alba TaxID=2791025 RepID=A0A931BZC9_9HYPH|nr:hypothetical protein [Microvirga alba]MBF9235592.1 hypothetical protein [Microvirga alba]